MRAFTIMAILVAGIMTATGSPAQVPYMAVTFPSCGGALDCECQGTGVLDTLDVIVNNLNMWVNTVEFALDFSGPQYVWWLEDLHLDGALFLGASYWDGPGGSIDGVTIVYQTPIRAVGPTVVMRVHVLWDCDDCENQPQVVKPVPHEVYGRIIVVRAFDYHVVELYGLTSLVCSTPWPTEPTTWGRVKALYR